MDTTPVVFIQAEGSDGVIHYLPAEALSLKIEGNENLKDTNNKDVLLQLANDTSSVWMVVKKRFIKVCRRLQICSYFWIKSK